MKATVLPLPVRDCAMTSLPASSSGRAEAWIGVGDSKPSSPRTRSERAERPKGSNVRVDCLAKPRYDAIGARAI